MGQLSQRGLRAVQTVSPSSIAATSAVVRPPGPAPRSRASRVLTGAGDGEQGIRVAGQLAVMRFAHRDGGGLQAQRPAAVAEAAPGAHGLGGRVGGERVGARSAGEGRVLQHDLAHERAPRAEAGTPPRQIPRVRANHSMTPRASSPSCAVRSRITTAAYLCQICSEWALDLGGSSGLRRICGSATASRARADCAAGA